MLFLRKFDKAITSGQSQPHAARYADRVAGLVPTHTRRSQESQSPQQFSTPIPIAWVAAFATRLVADDVLLEPSAGTGLMAIWGEIARARIVLNEYAPVRNSLSVELFEGTSVTRHDAAHIDDYLDRSVRPAVVVINPPLSAGVNVEGIVTDAVWRHLQSAFARLVPGGRLVTITAAPQAPQARRPRH